MAHGQSKGPDDQMLGDQPPRLFGKDLSEDDRKAMVTKAYAQLKTSFQKMMKPDGEKNAPAKTCRDLFAAYPDKPSGQFYF